MPDSFTPIIVTPIGASTVPWLGSDKKYHVSYDLQLTNGSRLPSTLTRVEVVDARHPATVLASLSGKQLVDSGDKTRNDSYVDYRSAVYAVADGTVTSTLDTVEANTPGTLPATDPALARKITVENVDGNHVILDLGSGVWAMYAHLIKGSLLVKPGDKVTKGQKIAELGNTGNANAPHLHFQLMNGPSLVQADALPYVIDRFSYQGQVLPQALAAADDNLSGTFLQGKLPTGQPRTYQLPLGLARVNFPSR